MPSQYESDFRADRDFSDADVRPDWNHARPMSSACGLSFQLLDLEQHHRDLDDAIALLSEVADETLVVRLKKRKLQLRDEISRVAALHQH
jgi:hypothetical protein